MIRVLTVGFLVLAGLLIGSSSAQARIDCGRTYVHGQRESYSIFYGQVSCDAARFPLVYWVSDPHGAPAQPEGWACSNAVGAARGARRELANCFWPASGPPYSVRVTLFDAPLAAGRRAPCAPRHWVPNMRLADSYARSRAGIISFAVRTPTRLWGYRAGLTSGSASVVKAMLMIAYLNLPSVRNRPLRARDRALLFPMIRESNNSAASSVFGIVGQWRLRLLARRAGMREFATNSVWGLTRISALDQTRLWLYIERFIAPRHVNEALTLLRTVTPSQRWGIGQATPRGWIAYFKGGWGSGTGRFDHQVTLLKHGRERVAVAVLTQFDPNHAYGKATLRGIFARLLAGLPYHNHCA